MKPSFLSIKSPGIYCPVNVIKNSGKAILSVELSEKVGSVKIGYASFNSRLEKLIWDCVVNMINPNIKTVTIAYLAENLFVIR